MWAASNSNFLPGSSKNVPAKQTKSGIYLKIIFLSYKKRGKNVRKIFSRFTIKKFITLISLVEKL